MLLCKLIRLYKFGVTHFYKDCCLTKEYWSIKGVYITADMGNGFNRRGCPRPHLGIFLILMMPRYKMVAK